MPRNVSDIAFTPAVKARQERHGSRAAYAGQIARRDWQTEITDDLAEFIARRDSFYMATVSQDGHPYIQHRGGPRGFLKVLDRHRLGFADYSGNRQYISAGNLDGNDRVHLFFMDYANSQRIKLWGRAQVIDDDPELVAQLMPRGYRARPERAVVISVGAWDVNCPQHIPALYPAEIVQQATAGLTARIAALEAENAELKEWLGRTADR